MDEKQIKYYEDKLRYEIDSWDLSVALKSSQKVIVIDTRSEELYKQRHIPTAITLPHRFINQENTKVFDKSYLYVSYCDGIGCNGSTKGALKLAKLGFNVKELIGGLDWWIRDGHYIDGTCNTKEQDISCGC